MNTLAMINTRNMDKTDVADPLGSINNIASYNAQLVCSWVTTTQYCKVKACGHEMVTCGLCSQWRTLPHVIS